jgi:hypothetical protein
MLSAHRTIHQWYGVVTGEERHHTPSPLESRMSLVLPPIEAYQVQPLPIVKAYADRMGVVEVSNPLVCTEMAIEPGTIVLGMSLETLSGRRPLDRVEECLTHQETALRLGQPVTPRACEEDTVGRVLERL